MFSVAFRMGRETRTMDTPRLAWAIGEAIKEPIPELPQVYSTVKKRG